MAASDDDGDDLFLRDKRPHPYHNAAAPAASRKRPSEGSTTNDKATKRKRSSRDKCSSEGSGPVINILTSEPLEPTDDDLRRTEREDSLDSEGQRDEDGERLYVTKSQTDRHSLANLLRDRREELGQSSSPGVVGQSKGSRGSMDAARVGRKGKGKGRAVGLPSSQRSMEEADDSLVIPSSSGLPSVTGPSINSSSPRRSKGSKVRSIPIIKATSSRGASSDPTTNTTDTSAKGKRAWTLGPRAREKSKPAAVMKAPSLASMELDDPDRDLHDGFNILSQASLTRQAEDHSATTEEDDAFAMPPEVPLDFDVNGHDLDMLNNVIVPETQPDLPFRASERFPPPAQRPKMEDDGMMIPDSASEGGDDLVLDSIPIVAPRPSAEEEEVDQLESDSDGADEGAVVASKLVVPELALPDEEEQDEAEQTRVDRAPASSGRPRGFRPAREASHHLVPPPASGSSLSGHSAYSVQQRLVARRDPKATTSHGAGKSRFFPGVAVSDKIFAVQPRQQEQDDGSDDDDDEVLVRRAPVDKGKSNAVVPPRAPPVVEDSASETGEEEEEEDDDDEIEVIDAGNNGKGKGKALAEELFPDDEEDAAAEEEDEFDDFEVDEDTARAIELSLQDQMPRPGAVSGTSKDAGAGGRKGFVWPDEEYQRKTFGFVLREGQGTIGRAKGLDDCPAAVRDFYLSLCRPKPSRKKASALDLPSSSDPAPAGPSRSTATNKRAREAWNDVGLAAVDRTKSNAPAKKTWGGGRSYGRGGKKWYRGRGRGRKR